MSLLNALDGLSRWPNHTYRAWSMVGCKFSVIQSRSYGKAAEPITDYTELKAVDVLAKLRSDILNGADDKTETPSAAGVRVLVVEGAADTPNPIMDTVTLNEDHQTIEQAIRVLGLSPPSEALLSLEINSPMNPEILEIGRCGAGGKVFPTRYMSLPNHTLLWTLNTNDNVTSAFLRCDRLSMESAKYLAHMVHHWGSSLAVPLFLPYLVCYMSINANGDMIRDIFDDIRMLESGSGFHVWEDTDTYLGKCSLAEELSQTSKRASGLAAAASSRKSDAVMIRHAVQSLLLEYQRLSQQHFSKSKKGPDAHWTEIHQCLKVLEGVANSQVLYSEESHQRALIQQSAVFHLLAQRDQSLNLDVARNSHAIALQSKKDTISMETIAFLTMLILPAGFTATLFAMPLFDWKAESPLSNRFWVYVAVTVPLTALTFTLWWVWSSHRLKRTYPFGKYHV